MRCYGGDSTSPMLGPQSHILYKRTRAVNCLPGPGGTGAGGQAQFWDWELNKINHF